jgi:hypothetical protein
MFGIIHKPWTTFPNEHSVPAQFQQGISEVRLEKPDFAEDGELPGQEQQAALKVTPISSKAQCEP